MLNNDFRNFVRNYELAYWGPNTASHQIGSPHEKNRMLRYQGGCIVFNVACLGYSEFDDDHMEKKGDKWLPLGKSFQNHVKLYVRYSVWLIIYGQFMLLYYSGKLPAVTINKSTKRIIEFLEYIAVLIP